ncbi:MAG TPA: Ig-like domain-containing protein [Clostridiales bacterium]|nr:Ig-like domain-containing protein [Clostridiales bacterium]
MKYLSKTLALVLVFLLAFSSFNLVAFAAAAEDVTALEAEEDYIPGFLERLKGLVDLIRNFIDSIKNFVFGLLGIVKPIPVRSVGLNKLFLLLQVGESEQLIATVYPDVATNKDVIWSSSDESIAVVDQNGLVTAAGSGIASITVTRLTDAKQHP